MQAYLESFNGELAVWRGSLIKPAHLSKPYSKEYLNKLAKEGAIERVSWGWYWIPAKVNSLMDFLRKDRNFKVISGQTAASYWNHDFVHRDVYRVKVKDPSYGKALRKFAKRRNWTVVVDQFAEDKGQYTTIKGVAIESIEDCVIECLQGWAFVDAFAVVYEHPRIFQSLTRKSYWKRISKTDIRIRQALHYGCARLNELSATGLYPTRKTTIDDDFVKSSIDEAVEKVADLG